MRHDSLLSQDITQIHVRPLHQSLNGFSIIEQLFTLTLIAILSQIGASSFMPLWQNQTLTSNIQQLNQIIQFAKLQALQSHHTVILCSLDHRNHCLPKLNHQLTLFIDQQNNGKFDYQDPRLSQLTLANSLQIHSSRSSVHIAATGLAWGYQQTLHLCNGIHGEAITISALAHTHLQRESCMMTR